MGQLRSDHQHQRGQTGPLAVVLVLTIVISGSVLVVALGSDSFASAQGTLDADRAEQGLTQFDSQTAMVALGESGTQQIALAGSGASSYEVVEDAGWMRVNVTNTTDGSTDTVMNVTLGAVTYENGDTDVAYQGGGVWRLSEGGGATMISPPEFHYRDATLTLPLVTVSGDQALSGRVSVTRDGTSQQYFPAPAVDDDWINPLQSGEVNVTVQSRYYEAWGHFFQDRTDGTARLDHGDRTATTTLVVPTGPQTVSNAIAATSASGEIKLAGSGSATTRTDAYNSSAGTGTYVDTRTDMWTIKTAGDLTVKGNSEVNGSVESCGFVTVKGSGVVTGDVAYADGTKITGTVGGEFDQISEVQGVGPADSYLNRRYDNISATNDNGDTGVPITGDLLDSGDQTLDPGNYHLDRLVVDGDTLTLDTGSDGEIGIAVRDYVQLKNTGEIEVVGSGEVRVYVDGQATTASGHHFAIESSEGVVDVDDDQNARQFWLYGHSDFRGQIDGTSSGTHQFEGVLYAPASTVGASTVTVEKGDVFGGIVAGAVLMENGGAVHYDRALRSVRAIPPEENIVRLTYLHISENPVEISDN